jgi:excisionase family DNA binding protein
VAETLAGRAPKPHERTVSILEAAEAVGVSRRCIYYWIAEGRIDWIRTAGGGVRIYWWSLWRDRDGRAFPEDVAR